MVRAKNYETVSTFVKVMQKKLWPLFFRTRCIGHCRLFRVTAVTIRYADSRFFKYEQIQQFIKCGHERWQPRTLTTSSKREILALIITKHKY